MFSEYTEHDWKLVESLKTGCNNLKMMIGWIEANRVRKWRFAGEVARQIDSRWSQQAAEWHPNCGIGHAQGTPRTRWEDQLVTFAGGDWMARALDVDT